MLQSEFFGMTKVNLTGDEYAEVEHIYNSVQMDKDEFCKLWLKSRDNKIIAELMNTIKKLENDCQKATRDCNALTNELECMKAQHDGELQQMSNVHKSEMEDFGRRLIQACEFEDMPTAMYQEVERELGIAFIIKTKFDSKIELQDTEIEYMVKKL